MKTAIYLIFLIVALSGCAAPAFNYRLHTSPRVSVTHRPLHPHPGETIEIIARAEAGAGATVAEIRVAALIPGSGSHTNTCSDTERCVLEIPAGADAGLSIYNASITDSHGRRSTSASSYVFQIGSPGSDTAFPLRVPFDLYEGQQAFNILLVRDRESYSSDMNLWRDAENLIYEGLLEDSAYRWRDNQLAFHYTPFAGVTRDYHSGVQSRCGQEPWLGDPKQLDAETEAAFADVVAVIHQKEGYRDCAGIGVVATGAGVKRHFSADGRQPDVFLHELGHALAGLSDEYRENTVSRTTQDEDLKGPPPNCSCCRADIVGSCLPGQPRCGIDIIAPECYPARPQCPQLKSDCPNPNIYASRRECEDAAASILVHPGVELVADPADCRQLCAGDTCPCLPPGDNSEIWILDRRSPFIPGVMPDDDLMGFLDEASPSEWVGPACERCLETTFCMRWEMARGRSPAEAGAHCLVP